LQKFFREEAQEDQTSSLVSGKVATSLNRTSSETGPHDSSAFNSNLHNEGDDAEDLDNDGENNDPSKHLLEGYN